MWSLLLANFLFLLNFTHCHNFGDKKDIFVVDSVLSPGKLKDVLVRFKEDDIMWTFHDVSASERSDLLSDSHGAQTSHHWMSRLVPSMFTDGDFNPVWEILKQQVITNFGVDTILLHRVEAQISLRGDAVVSSRECSGNSKDDLLLVLFVVPKWKKDSYGEMVIYGKDGEILKAIHPHNGRVVMLSCKYSFVLKPPAMDCKGRLRTITFHVSTSNRSSTQLFTQDKLDKYMRKMYDMHSFQGLKSIAIDNSKLDVGKHITRQFITTKGHPILVFDDMISPEILNIVADIMVNGTYADDPASADSSDNVQWILAFEVDSLVQSPLWHYAKAVVKYASKKDGYYPYDISCNSIRSHDTTTIHLDCEALEDEYTMLIYLNRNWTENDHGETVFFGYDRKEMVFAVKPKFGRVAIFQGTIPHSARPPSPKRHGEPKMSLI